MGFQVQGVELTKKGGTDKVSFPPFPPLKQLLDTYIKGGGKLWVCGPCMTARGIAAADLIEGATQVDAPTFVAEILEAANSLIY